MLCSEEKIVQWGVPAVFFFISEYSNRVEALEKPQMWGFWSFLTIVWVEVESSGTATAGGCSPLTHLLPLKYTLDSISFSWNHF